MVSALLKIGLVILSVFVGKRGGKRVTEGEERGPEPEALRDPAREWARTLDLFFAFALVGSVMWFVGALRVGPLKSRGYDAYGELIGLLLMFGFKCLVFVVVPATLLYFMLRVIDGLLVRIVVYGLFASIGFGASHFATQRADSQQKILDAAAAQERIEQDQRVREAQSMERARETAARKEAEEHDLAVARLTDLTIEVYAQWHEDLQTAGAIGMERDVPPMLGVADVTPTEKRVTNLTARRICVKLARVLRQPGGDYDRCPADVNQSCHSIAPRASALVLLLPHGEKACQLGMLEYRVGSPLDPEPSWWSASALLDLTPRAADYREKYSRMTTIDLRNEEARLETVLADTARSFRWSRELRGAPRALPDER